MYLNRVTFGDGVTSQSVMSVDVEEIPYRGRHSKTGVLILRKMVVYIFNKNFLMSTSLTKTLACVPS